MLSSAQAAMTFSAVPGASVAWQQAVVSLGCAHFDWELACRHFAEAISGQSPEGAIPLSAAPAGLALLEPPHFAPVLWRLAEYMPEDPASKDRLAGFFDVVYAHQRYWYKHRDTGHEGLVAILDPRESPQPMATTWDGRAGAGGGFLVQDPYLNALLALSNLFLIRIGNMLGHCMQELLELHELTVYSMNEKLWNAEYGIYCPYDLHRQELILSGALAGWMPWVSAVPDQSRAEAMRDAFEINFHGEAYFLSASNSIYATDADSGFPFRGAVHIWDNWLLFQGLHFYEFSDLAKQIRQDMLHLVDKQGFRLFFCAEKRATGYRDIAPDRQAAAAGLIIDLLMNKPFQRVLF